MNTPPYPPTLADAAKRMKEEREAIEREAKESAEKRVKEKQERDARDAERAKWFFCVLGVVCFISWLVKEPTPPKPAYTVPPELRARYNVPDRPTPGIVWVDGYYRKDGTFVQGHYRTAPDGTTSNNWSVYPNVNPYTGQRGSR